MGKRDEIKKQVTKLDMFGQKIELLYKQQSEHLTFFGGCISLMNGFLFIFVAFSYGSELFLKNNPVTNFSEESVSQPEQFNMTFNSFNMAFGIQNPHTFEQFIDESVYTMSVIRSEMKKVYNETTQQVDQIWSETDLGPYPCELSNFQVEGSLEYFQNLQGINQMYCFDQRDHKASIAGDFDANFFEVIVFSVYQCQNKTEEEAAKLIEQGKKVVVCKTQEEIDHLLMNGFFAAYYTDKVINPKLRDNPFNVFPRDVFWPTSNKLVKELTMYWRNVYIESDMGIINEDIQIKRDVIFSYQTEQVTYGQSNKFINMVVRFEKAKQSRYFRNYMKIEDVLAQISGVMSLFMVVSAYICQKISQLDLSQNLVNEVFSFQGQDEEDEEQNRLKEERSYNAQKLVRKFTNRLVELKNNKNQDQSPSNTSKDQVSFHQANNQAQKDNQEATPQRKKEHSEILSNYIKNYKREISIKPQEKEEKMQENLILKLFEATHKVIHLYYYDYFLYYVFPFFRDISKKKKQIEYSQNLLDKHLDVMYLITKLQEVDKLKMLLLSEDQIKLFNYLPKPTIRESDVFKQKAEVKLPTVNENKENSQLNTEQANQNKKFLQIEKFNLMYMDERTEIQKAADAYSAFMSLKKHQNRTEIDTKLLKMLDPKILDYFLDEKELQQFHNSLNSQLNDSQSSKQQTNSPLKKFQAKVNLLRTKQVSQFANTKEDNYKLLQSQNTEQQVPSLLSSPSSYRTNVEYKSEEFEGTNINLLQKISQKSLKKNQEKTNMAGVINNDYVQSNNQGLNYQSEDDKQNSLQKDGYADHNQIELDVVSDIRIPLEDTQQVQQGSQIPDSKQIRQKQFTALLNPK